MKKYNGKKFLVLASSLGGVYVMVNLVKKKQDEAKVKEIIKGIELPPTSEDIDYSTVFSKIPNYLKAKLPKIAYQRGMELYDELNKRNIPTKHKVWIFLQAMHESAIFQKPAGKYNYWGIKVPSVPVYFENWKKNYLDPKDPVSIKFTFEILKGKKMEIISKFANFASITHAVNLYLKLTAVKEALSKARTLKEFVAILKDKGYFTDYFDNYYLALKRHNDNVMTA